MKARMTHTPSEALDWSPHPPCSEPRHSSCLKAVNSGLPGRTVLLPTEDAAGYQSHVENYTRELKPLGARESILVQAIADTEWRLMRIPALEMAIYARGRSEFAEALAHEHAAARPGLIELETFLTYEKQLRNLQLQESRLRRHREKDLTELRTLQKERLAQQEAQLARAAQLYTAAQAEGRPFDPAGHGFEFSVGQIEAHRERVLASDPQRDSRKAASAGQQRQAA